MGISLVDKLPYEIDGIKIYPDFRNMLRLEQIMHNPDLDGPQQTLFALKQLFSEMPASMDKALADLTWFYSCGKAEKRRGGKSNTPAPYDFNQDSSYIYSAFYSVYKISLTTIDFLHWWEFVALFEGLPEDVFIRKIMYWRAVDPKNIPKKQRPFILEMKRTYALEGARKTVPDTLEEKYALRQQQIDRLYAEAQRKLEERESDQCTTEN